MIELPSTSTCPFVFFNEQAFSVMVRSKQTCMLFWGHLISARLGRCLHLVLTSRLSWSSPRQWARRLFALLIKSWQRVKERTSSLRCRDVIAFWFRIIPDQKLLILLPWPNDGMKSCGTYGHVTLISSSKKMAVHIPFSAVDQRFVGLNVLHEQWNINWSLYELMIQWILYSSHLLDWQYH